MKSPSDMQLLGFFAATNGVTWSGIAFVVALHGWDVTAVGCVGPAAIVTAMVLGPGISGFVLTFAYDGRHRLWDLRRRRVRWRIGVQWYAIAFCTLPMLLVAMLLALSWIPGPMFARHFQPVLILAGIGIAAFEETGWTGFATPRLLRLDAVGMAGFGLWVSGALGGRPISGSIK
jgi:uncharacterized protein